MSELDILARELLGAELDRALPAFALVCARLLPLAFVAPWLGWKGIATYVRASAAIVIAFALTPLALRTAAELPSSGLSLVLLALREVLIGIAFAVASSIALWALGWAGELIDRFRGAGAMFASGPSGPTSPLGVLHLSAAVALFLSLGGHRTALSAFGRSLVEAPIGTTASTSDLAHFALGAGKLVTLSLELALAFAAPAALAFVVLEIALGLAHRIAPELALWTHAVPVRAALGIGVALIGLAALLPELAPLFAESIDAARELVRALGP